MLETLRRLFTKRTAPPAVAMKAHPVGVNPTPSERELRRAARLARLRQAMANGDKRPEVELEIARLEKEA